MIRRDLSTLGRLTTTALIAGIAVAVAALSWFGYRAAREWRRSSELLEQRRTENAADLFVRVLVRDMRGVESRVLRGLDADQITFDEPHDLSDVVAGAFARYPYPEAFFGWDAGSENGALFFTRADRRPPWLPPDEAPVRFPVTVVRDEATTRHLMDLVAGDAAHGQRFAIFETVLDGRPYQVIARLLYRTSRRATLQRVFGFVVNLEWARSAYLSELTEVVGQIATSEERLAVAIVDDEGRLLAGTPEALRSDSAVVRRVRALFCDPALDLLDPDATRPGGYWTVHVSSPGGAARLLAMRGADWTITVTAVAALSLGVGLLLAGRALRASADLAKVRSDFVATVTHELKTPLATLRIVGETLSRGRLTNRADIQDYAHLVDQEAKRLSRLVDNLLAYSRVTDVSEVYSFEPVAVADMVDDVLRGFHPQFAQNGFELAVNIPPDLPPVRGDRTALGLVFDNLIDNAMRYSGENRWIGIQARQTRHEVHIDVADRGVGIPADEVSSIQRRFVRGANAASHGSGLGLAIVTRIVKDHGGTLHIDSLTGAGTTVSVSLPLMERHT